MIILGTYAWTILKQYLEKQNDKMGDDKIVKRYGFYFSQYKQTLIRKVVNLKQNVHLHACPIKQFLHTFE